MTFERVPPPLVFCSQCFVATPENQLLQGECYPCAGFPVRCEMCGGERHPLSGRLCRRCYMRRAKVKREVKDTRRVLGELQRTIRARA